MLFSAVHKILPVPNYLRLPSVGVDISDSSLKYIQFSPDYHHHQLRIACHGDIDLPAGTVARGEVLDVAKLTEALKQLKAETNVAYVRISLPEERAYIFETEIKRGTSYKEIRGALEFRLEENVPLSPRDAFFDYEILPVENEHAPLRVSVTVYGRETITKYYEAARAAGLVPLSFEVEAAAIARAALPPKLEGAHMIIDFGKTRTGVGIVRQGTLLYTSTIDIGGDELSKVLQKQLSSTDESDFTRFKNTVGLVPTVEHAETVTLLTAEMEKIVAELNLRLQYWNNHNNDPDTHDIRSIVLCGGSSNLKGLPSFLETKLSVPASHAAVWQNAFSLDDIIPPIDLRHSYGYATAIGLALAGHIAFYD